MGQVTRHTQKHTFQTMHTQRHVPKHLFKKNTHQLQCHKGTPWVFHPPVKLFLACETNLSLRCQAALPQYPPPHTHPLPYNHIVTFFSVFFRYLPLHCLSNLSYFFYSSDSVFFAQCPVFLQIKQLSSSSSLSSSTYLLFGLS